MHTRYTQTSDNKSGYTPAASLIGFAVQPQLTVGAVDDPLEKEADEIADKMIRMPDIPLVQRKCAACKEEDQQLQRKPRTDAGRHLLAHELTHTVQQSQTDPFIAKASTAIQRRPAPYIKKVTVHLTPKPEQSADLEWEGTPPADATGADHFTVSTGKGYSADDECTRHCCSDPETQCAPPWDQPGKKGACCTYTGNNFWTAKPLPEHNTWKWWTPIQPYYGIRGIALHGHPEVTGKPIGHGCVRMHDDNAKRIHDYSNGTKTKVIIEGKAAPVQCDDGDRCAAAGK